MLSAGCIFLQHSCVYSGNLLGEKQDLLKFSTIANFCKRDCSVQAFFCTGKSDWCKSKGLRGSKEHVGRFRNRQFKAVRTLVFIETTREPNHSRTVFNNN